MRIAVLIKQVPDTWGERKLDLATGRLDRDASDRIIDEIGERALEVALQARDAKTADEVVVVTMGPAPAAEAVKKGLSMGADSGIHISDDALAGSDTWTTAEALAGALREGGFDLVIAGNESTDGRGGVVPAMVAELLGLPLLAELDEVTIGAGEVSGSRGVDDAILTVSAPLPALVSITERTPEPRFPNLRGIMGAKKKPVAGQDSSAVGVEGGAAGPGAHSVVTATAERPPRSAGTIVEDDGTAAAQLAEFLAKNRLI
ncbi:MAG: electron transfer flavoprotein subunit beta/FixA family protein [Actinomycetales bacterium]|nr:electron transfer flavoprotein subunit beta/FixA family protein [Actinomycetales bacterium]